MKTKYWIGFSSIEQIDSAFIQRLYNYFGDIEKAFNANISELSHIDGLSVKKAENFLKNRDKTDTDKVMNDVISRGIQILTRENDDYPYLLRQITTPPAVLYIKGDLKGCNLEKTIAIVGSRKASSAGKDTLKKIIEELRNTDICIVSGLAAGIDSAAHISALENNLKTIGVIASGFDFVYPESNKSLYQQIENGGGAIVTEYFPTFEPIKFRFPQRNRIITGLSFGTLVVEAALKSGALISANLTLEQGRELMCVPGLISNPNTEGIYKLLKDGAAMVTNAQDILNTLNWEIIKTKSETSQIELNYNEQKILNSLKLESKSFDNIQYETNINTTDLLTCLTTLELKGIIKQVEGDRYTKA